MAHQSDTALLTERLDAIRAERARIKQQDDALSADEQRLQLALEVIKSVKASLAQVTDTPPQNQAAAEPAVEAAGGATAAVLVQPKLRLQDLILQALNTKDGVTSLEVVSVLSAASGAKRDSILSTLSRMTSAGMVRRQGRLYFRSNKGEGPEVATTGPSVATESVRGQHTSSAPIGENGTLL